MQTAEATAPTGAAPSGGVVVPAGSAPPGSVILVRGPVDVYGTVHGDVLTIAGDVVVHPGARVDGTVASLLGHTTRLDTPAGAASTAPAATSSADTPPALAAAVGVPLGWFLLLAALGAAVATRAGRQLQAVREEVEQHPVRALGAGLAGQLLVTPALVLIVVALCATIIGIVAVPLAVVLFAVAVAGLATLGFLAAAAVLGRALSPRARAAASARAPAAVLVGLGVFLALWLLAGALAGVARVPGAALAARALALAATWVAASAGFGAVLLTRAGTRTGARTGARARRDPTPDTLVTERGVVPAWQTPTPIATLAAARPRAATPASAE